MFVFATIKKRHSKNQRQLERQLAIISIEYCFSLLLSKLRIEDGCLRLLKQQESHLKHANRIESQLCRFFSIERSN